MSFSEAIAKKYGDVMTDADKILEVNKQVFSISPALDIALSGGVPEGSWVAFAGPPGCGKSTTALQLLSSVQNARYNIEGQQRKCFYLDVEHRLKKMNLLGVHGIDPTKVKHVHSTREQQLSAEDFLEILKQIIRDGSNYGGIAIVDSCSALCPTGEITDAISGTIRSTQPKVMGSFCRQLAGVAAVMNFTVVFIQHLITNTSGYGEKWLTDGGEKIKYQLDIKLITKGKPPKWAENGTKEDPGKPIGQEVEWEVIKSALGQSGLSCKSYLRYGYGLDEVKEICVLAKDLAVIDVKGSWFSLNYNGEVKKFQGEQNLYLAMQADPLMSASIFGQAKSMLGLTSC